MKISPVKKFVATNIKKITPHKYNSPLRKNFNMYGRHNEVYGDYFYVKYNGGNSTLSVTQILDPQKIQPIMKEAVVINKEHVFVKNNKNESGFTKIPKFITTMRTTLDYVNDKYITIRTVRKLKNELVRIGKDDKDFLYNEKMRIYKELTEKPKFEVIEDSILEQGSIKELKVKEKSNIKKLPFPYRYW